MSKKDASESNLTREEDRLGGQRQPGSGAGFEPSEDAESGRETGGAQLDRHPGGQSVALSRAVGEEPGVAARAGFQDGDQLREITADGAQVALHTLAGAREGGAAAGIEDNGAFAPGEPAADLGG